MKESRASTNVPGAMMDAAAAHKAASAGRGGSGGGEEAWRWPGWRAPARVELVVLGFLATLTLLLLAFGGAGNQPAFSSSSRSEFAQKPGKIIQRRTFGSSFGGGMVRVHGN